MQSLISNMKKFFIITNEQKDMNLAMTNAISDYIIAKGGTCMHYVSTKSGWRERNLRRFQPSDIDAECIIVLGGDGTLVRAARDMASIGIPLIGVILEHWGICVNWNAVRYTMPLTVYLKIVTRWRRGC